MSLFLHRIWLFIRIVYRHWEVERIGLRLAWDICRIMWPGREV
jgi:hypothetical protein